MELIRRPFKTNLFQEDYIGNAIGMLAPEVEFLGSNSINPENFRVHTFYPPERLTLLQDSNGRRFESSLEENMEPELIEYCENLVDRLKEILQTSDLSDEEKATKIMELHNEAKAKKNMDDILNWKEAKQEAERMWKEGPDIEIPKAA